MPRKGVGCTEYTNVSVEPVSRMTSRLSPAMTIAGGLKRQTSV